MFVETYNFTKNTLKYHETIDNIPEPSDNISGFIISGSF